jgi:hypothetical protein
MQVSMTLLCQRVSLQRGSNLRNSLITWSNAWKRDYDCAECTAAAILPFPLNTIRACCLLSFFLSHCTSKIVACSVRSSTSSGTDCGGPCRLPRAPLYRFIRSCRIGVFDRVFAALVAEGERSSRPLINSARPNLIAPLPIVS